MDNGLIFPYPRRSAHAGPSETNHPKPVEVLRDDAGGAWDLTW